MLNFDGLFIFSFLVLSPLKLIPGSSLKLQLGLHTILFQANEHKQVLPQLLYRLIIKTKLVQFSFFQYESTRKVLFYKI